jgi:molybdate transport system ATP-binding protein
MLRVALRLQRPQFALSARFAAPTPGVTALFGPSGSGKSTVVNLIAGLLEPDEGEVQLGEEVLTDTAARIAVPPERRSIGYVFQDARLFPHLTVAGNLHYGARRVREPRAAIRFDDVVALLGLGALLTRRPYQLSGGEAQRVALGRALLAQPRLLLMDEPLSALDAQTRELLLDDLVRLMTNEQFAGVYVTHNLAEAVRLGSRVLVLSRRPGRVREEVSIDVPLQERSQDHPELQRIQRQLWELLRDEAREAEREVVGD